MATLIPALGACLRRMTLGEKRLAERLEDKLDDDYLLWYDVPVGPQQLHPDFIVLHPSRGLLILEVKDFRLGTIVQADKEDWTILDAASGEPKTIQSPFAQARHYAHAVLDALRADKRLVHPDGRRQGEVVFAWSYGVVLPNITRKQFTEAQLGQAIAPHRVICSDEMTDSVEPEAFQSRLWEMFPYERYHTLTLPQIDRVRWILFPQVRIPEQASLFDEADMQAEVPDMLRVMDLQQEQLARSLGDGHRVIHGVAGSGKTILALAAAIEQTMVSKRYRRIIATRSVQGLDQEIGFLPGTEAEKMEPWLGAITDNLEALHMDDENTHGSVDYILQKVPLQFKSLNYIRGRSFQQSLILIDECQNLTPHQMKTIITRAGTGSKVVCLGNLAQIDTPYLSAPSSGLTYLTERFKDFPHGVHITLQGVPRSLLAEYAEANM